MALAQGSRLGQYEVLSPLGAGGMGEVYRARDLTLGRDVAIKVLPELFAADPDRLARIAREAQVLASLNHPNIAHVYGMIGAADGLRVHGLVMEFVDGEDLSGRLSRSRLPVGESLAIARQIADALDAAHHKGIVHRDLKPANIKLTDEGIAKVLDFGLAKALDAELAGAGPHDLANSPTITSPAGMTRLGAILGTAAYMAPEQAKGKAVDRRADIWAFGVVLYEMLSGKTAFAGETLTDVLAAIVTRDPDWTALPPDTPPAILRLLRRCLDRDARRRLADAGELRFQIEEAIAPRASVSDAAGVRARPRGVVRWLPWAVSALCLAAAIGFAWRARTPPVVVTRFSIDPPPESLPSLVHRPAVNISADGSTIVFVATTAGVDRLYVRRQGSFDPVEITGTEGAGSPVISPDAQWVAFTTSTELRKVPIGGGAVLKLAEVTDARGLSWDVENTLVYADSSIGGISRVSASGGTPAMLTVPTPKVERTHRWPQMLPDGDTVLYTIGTFESPDDYDNGKIEALRISKGEKKTLLSGAAMARAIDGYLVFVRASTLFAVPFDARTLDVRGSPVAVVNDVGGDASTGAAHFAVSRNGDLVYFTATGDRGNLRPAWVDPNGKVTEVPVPAGIYSDPRLSPGGDYLAVSYISRGRRDLWIHDFKRGTFTPLTFSGQNLTPVWSRDGSFIYSASPLPDGSGSAIHRQRSDGSRQAEALATASHRVFLNDVSADGKMALIDRLPTLGGKMEVALLPLTAGAKPRTVAAGKSDVFGGRLSPNGRWIAYVSVETGRAEIYVQSSDDSGGRWQVSATGGEEPKWSADGRTLFFRTATRMMASKIDDGAAFKWSTPTVLFTGVFEIRRDGGFMYDIHPVTRRFLMIRPAETRGATSRIRLVQNWVQELRTTLRR